MNTHMENLKNIELFLLDMDGTFYLGDKLMDSSRVFLERMKETGGQYAFLTNNSSKSGLDYVKKLKNMGVECGPEKIITSGEASAVYLNKRAPGAGLYVVGTPSLEEEFRRAGFVLTDESPDYAVLGFDTTLTYEKLRKLCDFARSGVKYVATHPDFNCPVPGGWIPDCGAMIAFVKASTGREPDVVIGKPNCHILDAALAKFKQEKNKCAIVGDRLYTDIALGVNNGVTSILVLSGETRRADLENSTIKPDYVFSDLGELAARL